MSEQDYDLAELYPARELPERLPPLPGGAKHALSKVWNWLNLGGAPRKTLRSIAIGRSRYTCDRWVFDFINDSAAHAKLRSPAKRNAARERAKAALQKAGI